MADKDEKKPEEKKEEKPIPKDNLVVTDHVVQIGGKEVKYTVTAGTIVLKEETPDREKEAEGEKPRAQVFFVAYTREGDESKSKRPLTFSFNGGPGSSSVWLHMGVLGPRRVVMQDDGNLPKPPYELTDNEYSLLDQTDLVFIDPMNTGYSRPVEGMKPKEWHGFKKDIHLVGDFIRLYTTRANRWLSPKFLIGESYGTTRAAGLSGYLQERHGMYLNGIMLISAVLDFATLDFNINNDLPYILFLPGYTATAWYHDVLKPHKPLETWLKEAEEFALGDYARALLKGDGIDKEELEQITEKVALYTGVSKQFVERSKLRINAFHYFKELLRERGLTVGRLDSRFTGKDRLGVSEYAEYDPLLTNVTGPYTAGFYDYVRSELKFESDLSYEILSGFVHPWSYAEFENPYLKIFVANGYYDLGTPYFATEYTFDHLGLDENVRKNITMEYYEAGHMMYIHMPSLKKMKEDLAEFIQSAM
jgi:carboxypeptidase C (cathepsin A)